MNTAEVLEIEQETKLELDSVVKVNSRLKKEAEAVLNPLGYSVTEFFNLTLNDVVNQKKIPGWLYTTPPVPCIDDLTEEEFDAMIQKSLDAAEAGQVYTVDEARKIVEAENVSL